MYKIKNDYRMVFIVGCPRSGTTWVWSIFKNHPDVITSTSESQAYHFIKEPFQNHIKNEENGWNEVINRFDKKGQGRLAEWVTKKDLIKYITSAKNFKNKSINFKTQYVIDNIFRNYFYKHGNKDNIFVEKTPHNIFYAKSILDHYPKAKIIEIIRDGRDVCVSLQELNKSWCPQNRRNQINTWLRHIQAGLKINENKKYSNRTIRVFYENLKKDTKNEIARMFQFAGIDSDKNLVKEIIYKTDFARYKSTGKGKAQRKGIVGDWINYFSKEDIQLYKKLAESKHKRIGYSI
jgi:hypothetical protein